MQLTKSIGLAAVITSAAATETTPDFCGQIHSHTAVLARVVGPVRKD